MLDVLMALVLTRELITKFSLAFSNFDSHIYLAFITDLVSSWFSYFMA